MMISEGTYSEVLQEKEDLVCKLQEEITSLKEQLAWFHRQLFGKKSEKTPPAPNGAQMLLPGFEEVPPAEEKKKPVAAHERKSPKRDGQDTISLPENTPVETTIIDLSEEDKVCKETGEPLVKIGEEITKKLAYRPGSYFVKEIIRIKYASPKNAEEPTVHIAPLPESLLSRCQADESLLADILVKKFADHLPLYRQSEILSRQNIFISRQTMAEWVTRAGNALKPLYEALKDVIKRSDNLFIDEVPIDLLSPGKGKTQTAYMWTLVGGKERDPPYRIYHFRKDRRHHHADDILKDYTGCLHSDKYGAYEALAHKKQFIWCPCFAHIRRKFIESETGDLPFRDLILEKLNTLFHLEQHAWELNPDERISLRQTQEEPLIDEITNLVKERLIFGKPLPKSKLKEALGYYQSLVPFLKNYISHPFARLDNNVAERAIRPLVLGRKNWLFIGSESAGESAAILLSLIQSARATGINPQAYLEDVMRSIMSHPSSKLEDLLPLAWKKSHEIL